MVIEDLKIQRLNKNAKGNKKCARSTSQRNKKCAKSTFQRNRKYAKYIFLQHRKPLISILKRDFNLETKKKLKRIQQLN